MEDPISEVVKFLLNSGIAGVIAAYFAQRYVQAEKVMHQLRDEHKAEMRDKQREIENLHALRLADWMDFAKRKNDGVLIGEGDTPVFRENQLVYPRTREIPHPQERK